MLAQQIDNFGDVNVFSLVEIPQPVPQTGEVLVKVSQVGLNYSEVLQRAGTYPGPAVTLPAVLGTEVVGTVFQLGDNVHKFTTGVRVAAPLFAVMKSTGGYAEYVTLPAELCVQIPDSVTDEQALAVMVQGLTAQLMLNECDVADKTVVITAAAGGVGNMLVQLTKLQGAAKVIGIAGSKEKLETVRSTGAHHAYSYHDPDWERKLSSETNGHGSDIVFDPVGGALADTLLSKLAAKGKFVSYGALSGTLPKMDEERILSIIFGGKQFMGFSLFAYLTGKSVAQELEKLFSLIASKKLKPTINQQPYHFRDVAKAHEAIQQSLTTGKVILHM